MFSIALQKKLATSECALSRTFARQGVLLLCELHEIVGAPPFAVSCLCSALDGYNATIFAYGQVRGRPWRGTVMYSFISLCDVCNHLWQNFSRLALEKRLQSLEAQKGIKIEASSLER